MFLLIREGAENQLTRSTFNILNSRWVQLKFQLTIIALNSLLTLVCGKTESYCVCVGTRCDRKRGHISWGLLGGFRGLRFVLSKLALKAPHVGFFSGP